MGADTSFPDLSHAGMAPSFFKKVTVASEAIGPEEHHANSELQSCWSQEESGC